VAVRQRLHPRRRDDRRGGGVRRRRQRPRRQRPRRPARRADRRAAGRRFEIIDNWATTGLAASGSHDYAANDQFVPAAQTFRLGEVRRPGPLYAWPGLFTANHAGVPLGIAAAALETAADVLEGKVVMPDRRPARDEPRVRAALGRAHALVGSARAYTFDVMGDVWATLVAGAEPHRWQRAALGGLPAHTAQACRQAVELLADAVGSDGIRRSCLLERHRRDLSTIAVHVLAQERMLELVGGLWLEGASLDHPLIAQRIV
jgi:alkylation response protein AidB-like acyl-CoA dehydrogenase